MPFFPYRSLINHLIVSCLHQKLNSCQDLRVYVMNYCKRMGMVFVYMIDI
jgi:hypothetical protein